MKKQTQITHFLIEFSCFAITFLLTFPKVSLGQSCPSSPFVCPEANDTCFIVDCGDDLDTQCLYRRDGPIDFSIYISRYVAPVIHGYLQGPDDLVNNGVVSKFAILKMPILDVDIKCDNPGGCECEYDAIYFNGHFVDYCHGENAAWVLNEIKIPIKYVKFPDLRFGEPARNVVRIDIDTRNKDQCWCTAIDWAALSFGAARPVILVHGFVGSSIVWADTWRPGLLSLPIHHEAINVGKTDAIERNSRKIGIAVERMRDDCGVDQINVVGHSKGAIDARHYVDSHNDVEKLLMLGAVNEGTPIVDWLYGLIPSFPSNLPAEIRDLFSPALYQMSTWYMRAFNTFIQGNDETAYINLAGDLQPGGTWPFDGGPWLEGRDDFIVQVSSVYSLPYSDDITYSKQWPDKSPTHTQLEHSQNVYNELIAFLKRGPNAQLINSEIPRADRNHEPLVFADASPNPIQRTEDTTGFILPGDTTTHNIDIEKSTQVSFYCYSINKLVDFVLYDPDGSRIDSIIASQTGRISYVSTALFDESFYLKNYTFVDSPKVGTWKAEISLGGTTAEGALYSIGAYYEHADIQMRSYPDRGYYNNGDPITITTVLKDGSSPITGSDVTAKVFRPDSTLDILPLYDDGSHGDPVPNDGEYVNSFGQTTLSGIYNISVTASKSGLKPFSRKDVIFVQVANSRSIFDGNNTYVVRDTNGDSLFDELDFIIGTKISRAGGYTLKGQLYDDEDGYIGRAFIDSFLTAGSHYLNLKFDGFDVFKHATDGPYHLKNVALAEDDSITFSLADFADWAASTGALSYRGFQRPDIYLSGNTFCDRVDIDSNGLYDSLIFSIEVDLRRPDYYQWSGNLKDADATVITSATNSDSLSAGLSVINLTFGGKEIVTHGVDGPFIVSGMLMWGSKGSSIVTSDIGKTPGYKYIEFEP